MSNIQKTVFHKQDVTPAVDRKVLVLHLDGKTSLAEQCSCGDLEVLGRPAAIRKTSILRWAYLDDLLANSGYEQPSDNEIAELVTLNETAISTEKSEPSSEGSPLEGLVRALLSAFVSSGAKVQSTIIEVSAK